MWYIHNRMLFSHKSKTLPFAASQMEVEVIMSSEIIHTKRNTILHLIFGNYRVSLEEK